MPFGAMTEMTIQALHQNFNVKNQGRLRGFVPQGLSNEPYNTHQQQIKHTIARFGLSPQILSLGRC
jgi:hypothetical protein